MADRITFDPSKIPMPDFSRETYARSRSSLIRNADIPEITNEEQAIAHLRQEWEEDNMFQRNQYQAQLEADEAAAAARRLEEEEQQKVREAEQRQRHNEAAQEQERRRAPLYNFTDGQSISKIPRHLHPYAQRRISQRKFVELWYLPPSFERLDRMGTDDCGELADLYSQQQQHSHFHAAC
ncbi:hypothetical protein FB446DRAFT_760667 [Lentinula raphanica]|nr:hypothetical protein FB446DRAFT_760667 [Lentinula raphanica]